MTGRCWVSGGRVDRLWSSRLQMSKLFPSRKTDHLLTARMRRGPGHWVWLVPGSQPLSWCPAWENTCCPGEKQREHYVHSSPHSPDLASDPAEDQHPWPMLGARLCCLKLRMGSLVCSQVVMAKEPDPCDHRNRKCYLGSEDHRHLREQFWSCTRGVGQNPRLHMSQLFLTLGSFCTDIKY